MVGPPSRREVTPAMPEWTVRRPADPEPSLPVKLFSYACLILTTTVVGAVGATFIFHFERHHPDSTRSERRRAQRVIEADTVDFAYGRAVVGGVAGAIAGVVMVVQPLPGRKRAP